MYQQSIIKKCIYLSYYIKFNTYINLNDKCLGVLSICSVGKYVIKYSVVPIILLSI